MFRNRLFSYLLLIVLTFSLFPLGYAVDDEHTGEFQFTVFPDMSMQLEMDVEGKVNSEEVPISSISSSMSFSPVSSEVTDFDLDVTVKIPLEYSLFLIGLDLDIDIHQDGLDSNGTINVGMSGMASLDGYFTFDTNEITNYSTLIVEGNITLWHTLIQPEFISGLIDNLSEYRIELSDQISVESQGNLTLTELSLVEYWNMSTSSILWMRASIEGDWAKASLAFASSSLEEFPQDTSVNITPLLSQTSDIEIRYDKIGLAFTVKGSGRYQGDFNAMANDMKNEILEDTLEDASGDTVSIIEDLLIPMEVDLTSFSMSFDLTATTSKIAYAASMQEFMFNPPDTVSLLESLQSSSGELSEHGYLLIINGGSSDSETVEIVVPEETTTPKTIETSKVVWEFSDLENLEKVTFNVDGFVDPGDNSDDPSDEPDDSSLLKTEYILPTLAISGLVLAFLLLRRK